jgi:hypothetical protein
VSRIVAVAVLALSFGVVAVAPSVVPAFAAEPMPLHPPVETWAWCGVHPDDPMAATAVRSMATVAGIDATFGPCNVPVNYTPAETGNRYVTPELYRRLVDINASVGMKTVVYDKRLWSTDSATRTTAINFWTPVVQHIAGWDMGDEFDPTKPEWDILIDRWQIVRGDAMARTGVRPFVNHLYWATDEALADLPGSELLLSYTRYDDDLGAGVARNHDAEVAKIMCGVNAFDHGPFTPTAETIRDDMAALTRAGCDQFLVFGGQMVYDSELFGDSSLVDAQGIATDWAAAVMEGSGKSSYTPVGPARLLETRAGEGLSTVDGQFNAIGARPEQSVTQLQITGRAGVPRRTDSVVLNITVTNPDRAGFITVYPCSAVRPNAAQLNYAAQSTVSTAVVAKLSDSGAVCIFSLGQTDLIVDINGYFPDGTSFQAREPARLLETRVGDGLGTADGAFNGIGVRTGGSVIELPVGGRLGVPVGASAVVLGITVTGAAAPGFVTMFPCGGPIPTAATVNYTAGSTVTNAVVARTGANGTVCLYTMAQVDLIVDLNGFHPAGASFTSLDPSRLLETRTGPGLSTIDGLHYGIGARGTDTVTVLPIVGRAGIPTTVGSVVLNITVTEPRRAGYVVAFDCDEGRPNAASVNYAIGATVSNMVVAEVASNGGVCIYTMAGTQLVVDVTSYHP